MSIIFQNGLLWPLLLLVSVPLLLHLFAHRKPPQYLFSCNDFILKVLKSTLKIKRPQNYLLLVLRTLLFLSLILMFLLPILFSNSFFSNLGKSKQVVIIIDASASMAYSEDGQTRFAAACAEASQVLAGLSSRDKANIIWLRRHSTSVYPTLGNNISYLQDALRKASVSNEKADVKGAIRLAEEMLSGTKDVASEICVISDFQETNWPVDKIKFSPDDQVVFIKVGRKEAGNQAITKVTARPSPALLGEEVTVFVEVQNFSRESCRKNIFLKAGEMRDSQVVMIPRDEKKTIAFRFKPSRSGTMPIEARLSEDEFAKDNTCFTVLPVRKMLDVGLINCGTEAGEGNFRYWKKALEALPWVNIKIVSGSNTASMKDLDFLMIDNWSGQHLKELQTCIANGTSLICAPGKECAPELLLALFGRNAAASLPGFYMEQSTDTFPLEMSLPEDSVFALFADGEYGDPAGGEILSRLNIDKRLFAKADRLLSYQDGIPALCRIKNGMTSSFLWNIPLSPEVSDWSARSQFVPLIGEILLNSRTRSRNSFVINYLPGMPLTFELKGNAAPDTVSLIGPDGNRVKTSINVRGSRPFLDSQDVEKTGIYQWLREKETMKKDVVNFDIMESNLKSLLQEDIKRTGGIAINEGNSVRKLHAGIKLWPFLLLLTVGLALMENAVMWYGERT